jgi:hypothetical protein
MSKRIAGIVLGAVLAAPAWADSITVGGLLDSADGRSLDVRVRYSPVRELTLGASIGHSESRLEQDGDKFSGINLGASVGLDYDAFFADASVDRWKDSGDLRSTTLRGALGWLSLDGIALSALVTHRDMQVTYTSTLLTGSRHIDFAGTGFGADVTYYGKVWTSGVRFLGYDYGRSVGRVRAVRDAGTTGRFPRLQDLVGSVATRAASTPDRELSLTLGRQFARTSRTSLTADLQWQRDALTGDKTRGGGLTLSLTPRPHLGVDISAGASKTDGAGTVGWAGVWLTLSGAK